MGTATLPSPPPPRDALEGKGPQRWPWRRWDRRLEGVAKAVDGGYCRLRIPLKPALGISGTVAGRRLGALEGGGVPPPLPMHRCPPPPPSSRGRVGVQKVHQRSMPTLCDLHRAPACKSCKGHTGVGHCCSRHHEGHPAGRPQQPRGGQRRLRQTPGGGGPEAGDTFRCLRDRSFRVRGRGGGAQGLGATVRHEGPPQGHGRASGGGHLTWRPQSFRRAGLKGEGGQWGYRAKVTLNPVTPQRPSGP